MGLSSFDLVGIIVPLSLLQSLDTSSLKLNYLEVFHLVMGCDLIFLFWVNVLFEVELVLHS